MKTVSNRQLRRTVVAQQQVLEDGLAPALRAVTQNEEITRARVAKLEAWRDGTLLARLRWLFTGK